MKRRSLRRRAAILLLGAFAIAAAWAAPSVLHDRRMEQEMRQLELHAATDMGDSPSITTATDWLRANGFINIGVGPYSRSWNGADEHGQSLNAEKRLSGGTLLWRPSTAKVFVRYSETGEFREAEWWHWRFDAGAARSRFRGELENVGNFAINVAMVWIIVLWLRRRRRRRKGLCDWCAYPIGQSPVCTECGAAHAVMRRIPAIR